MVSSRRRKTGEGMTGAQLTKARKRAGISLRGMAVKLGISPSYLVDIEKGRRAGEKAQALIVDAGALVREHVEEKEAETKGATT